MKKIVYAVILTIITNTYYGQDFAPVGAKWYYSESYFDNGNIGYMKIESINDTIIKGKNCRQLTTETPSGVYDAYYNYVFQEDSIVYFYNQMIDSFQILYNYKAKKGDSWITVFHVMDKLDSLKFTVDSVSNININGHLLIHQWYKQTLPLDDSFIQYSDVIEKIGDNHFLFNLYSTFMVADGILSDGLRCYEDSVFGLYSTGIASSCTYTWSSTYEKNLEESIEIYPNPTTGQIILNTFSEKPMKIEIIDLMGKIIDSRIYTSKTQLDLSKVNKGVYILTINIGDKLLVKEKIIKQ